MPKYEARGTVDASADALFAYLSEVKNLPKYLSQMTSAERTGGETIRTTARVNEPGKPEQTYTGEAWFRVNDDARRIEWGAKGKNDYHGALTVTGDEDGSEVSIEIHTETPEGGHVEGALEQSVANIRRLVEAGVAQT